MPERDVAAHGEGESLKAFHAGAHRIVPPSATVAALAPKLRDIGITRVADVTGLDYVGIPVVMSVRPASRNLSVQQGKGVTLDAAKASAIMESVESFAGEQHRPDIVHRPAKAFPPRARCLPRHLLKRALPDGGTIPWTEGRDLLRDGPVHAPEELVSIDYAVPSPEGYGHFAVSSNGLATGNSADEAILHGLCEVVERDAQTLWQQTLEHHRTMSRIDPAACRDDSVAFFLERFDAAGMSVEVWETTSDLGIPSFHCEIDDRDARPPFLGRFAGSGCHPSIAVALCRALAEAAQSRLTFIVGTRDDIEPDGYATIGWRANLTSFIIPAAPKGRGRAIEAVSLDGPTIRGDLDAVLARLEGGGIDSVVAVDLTRLGIPCWRVIVPGLEGVITRPGYQRGPRARKALRAWR